MQKTSWKTKKDMVRVCCCCCFPVEADVAVLEIDKDYVHGRKNLMKKKSNPVGNGL